MSLLEKLRNTVSQQNQSPSSSSIPPSDCYSILSNERRRLVIEYLAEFDSGETVSCGDLADHLESLGDERKAAYISVIQQHAGRLDQSGIVAYDDREKTVTVRSELHAVHDAHKSVENVLD